MITSYYIKNLTLIKQSKSYVKGFDIVIITLLIIFYTYFTATLHTLLFGGFVTTIYSKHSILLYSIEPISGSKR